MSELGIVGYGLHQKQVGAGQFARQICSSRALQLAQQGQPHQSGQRMPIARGAACDDAELQRSEGRRPKRLRRIECRHRHLRIGEHDAAVGHAQCGRRAAIDRRDLNFLAVHEPGSGCLRTQ